MTTAHSCRLSSSSFLQLFYTIVALVLSLFVETSHGQGGGCSNTCPPLNYGTPVPALCEGDDLTAFPDIHQKEYSICHGGSGETNTDTFSFDSLQGKIRVVANYYTGCNAGRRESGVFAHVAQRFYNQYPDSVVFIQSVKGGGTCDQWASLFQRDAARLYPDSPDVVPKEMPLSVNDVNYEIRDDLFTAPFGHPAYVILDADGIVRHKFIGPCCGYESYYDCTTSIAKGLDDQLTEYLEPLLMEMNAVEADDKDDETNDNDNTEEEEKPCSSSNSANNANWSEWSPCSIRCGRAADGIQFRYTLPSEEGEDAQQSSCDDDNTKTPPLQTRTCPGGSIPRDCDDNNNDDCIKEFGETWNVETVASGFDSPRDVDFHPTPGLHLGTYAEGRTFHPSEEGDEAWVVNGGNHSISIVASLGTPYQTTLSRRDRGYYHYMMNGTALSFNKVKNSGRSPSRDSFNYWAICNDNTNTYVDTKEPNYFMGPTLYDSNPQNRNTVNRLGEECRDDEPCYFLHADMLHEAPACTGIVHDPEVATAYGTVYWAFDTTGNRQTGQLVRFDFQQPHGPGSMDHSIAAVRRYVEIELERGPPGVHSGMAVHPTRRELYVAVPGANRILVVDADSGSFARTAREEYPIFSNRLPSFEYSIWECVDSQVLDSSVDMPTGMALSLDGERLFVAERGTGNILVYDIASRTRLFSIPTQFTSIGGMAVSPSSGELYFVDDDTNGLYRIEPLSECSNPIPSPANPLFQQAVTEAQEVIDNFSLSPNDYYTCQVNPIVPDSSFFDQVHEDTGYADDNPNVQSNMTGMDAAAALLANRTDCGYDSDLNFDALLLGGYFCHPCLPEQDLVCDFGGTCTNVQWRGYVCDNDIRVITTKGEEESAVVELQTTDGSVLDSSSMTLTEGVTYRFTAEESVTLCAYYSSSMDAEYPHCGTSLLLSVRKDTATKVLFTLEDKRTTKMTSLELAVVAAAVEEQDQQAQEQPPSSSNNNTVLWIIIGVIIGLVVLVLVVIMIIVRHRKKRMESKNAVKAEKSVGSSEEDEETLASQKVKGTSV